MNHKKILAFAISIIFLMAIVNAEVYMSSNVRVNNQTQTTTHFVNVVLKDTSASGIGTSKYVPIGLYLNIQELPYNISQYYPQYQNSYVDWCNYSVYAYHNIYDSLGNIINVSIETFNFYASGSYPTGVTNYTQYNLLAQDSINAFATCHYTNPETNYIDSVLFGQVNVFLPAFQCNGCEDKTFEELSRENENINARITNELSMYQSIYKLIKYNLNLWNIASWIFKIFVIFIAFALLIKGVMALYHYIKEIEKAR